MGLVRASLCRGNHSALAPACMFHQSDQSPARLRDTYAQLGLQSLPINQAWAEVLLRRTLQLLFAIIGSRRGSRAEVS